MLKDVSEIRLLKPEVLKSENLAFRGGRREGNQQRTVVRSLHDQRFDKGIRIMKTQELEVKTQSNLSNKGEGCLIDQVNFLPCRGISVRSS